MAGVNGLQRVTLTLGRLLGDRMQRRGDVVISYGIPRSTPPPAGPILNLFLYHVKEKADLRNDEDPRRSVPGSYGKPPLALELGYLLTSYSRNVTVPNVPNTTSQESVDELDAQEILADAMRVLHETPIVTRKTPMLHAVGPVLDPALQFDFESLRITQRQYGLDDLTKLWTALKEDYQRSVAYEVSVVRIERSEPDVVSAPVLTRAIALEPSASSDLVLRGLEPEAVPPGELVTLRGEGLDDPSLRVAVSDATSMDFPPPRTELPVVRDPNGVHFSIPNLPAVHRPGRKLVELVVDASPGHVTISNAAALNVLPRVDAIAPLTGPFDGTVTVTITGLLLGVVPGGPAGALAPFMPSVLFGSWPIPRADLDLTQLPTEIRARLRPPPGGALNPPAAGQMLPIRVRVNGVESRSWRRHPLSGDLEMDPARVFTVT